MRDDEQQRLQLFHTHQLLEDALRRYSDLYNFAPVGYVTLDSIGLIEEMNRTAAELLAVDHEHIIGIPFRGFVETKDRSIFADHLRRCVNGTGQVLSQLDLRGRNGKRIPVQLHSAPARPGGRGLCYHTTLIDLTEIRESEIERQRIAIERETAKAADAAKDRFLAVLSHELRNPLVPVITSISLLETAMPGSDVSKRALEVIARQVHHLTRLVDDLLDLNRINHGKIKLRREQIELNDLVRTIVSDHQSLFDDKGLRCNVRLATRPLHVDVDPERIAQVLETLLQNAAKFTDRGGFVERALDATAGSAVVRVRDSGVGIAPEMLPRLFDAYMQAETSLAHSRGGLGLGLALVKNIVELHEGSITANSGGLGKGAEFVVHLPLAPVRLTPAVSAASAVPSRPLRILVIDDHIDSAESLKALLELDNHVVEIAFDGALGIERARQFTPELVLCDLGLPDIDGYAVARELRAIEMGNEAYLVALSGYVQEDDIARAKQAGFDAHLAKPISFAELERLLANLSSRISE